jgi:hypothetical protein
VEQQGAPRRQPRKIQLRLSPQAEKYVRRDAPVGVRRMAARGALPLQAVELATVLFVLLHDPDAEVKETARASLVGLPEGVMTSVLTGETPAPVLTLLAQELRDDEPACEKLALNACTDDRTVAFLATLPHRRVVEIVSQNQERMLRCSEIVDALGNNPLTGRATIERILTFLGVSLEAEADADGPVDAEDVSEEDATAALAAILGEDLKELAGQLARETGEAIDEDELHGNLYGALQKMTVMQKVKLARLGGTEARGLLIRDRNKIVATAAITSPRITDNEVVSYAKSRAVCDEVLRIISMNREWTRNYQVKLSLVTNPKAPQATALKFLNYLQDRDLKGIMKSRDVPSAVSVHARRILQKKGKI